MDASCAWLFARGICDFSRNPRRASARYIYPKSTFGEKLCIHIMQSTGSDNLILEMSGAQTSFRSGNLIGVFPIRLRTFQPSHAPHRPLAAIAAMVFLGLGLLWITDHHPKPTISDRFRSPLITRRKSMLQRVRRPPPPSRDPRRSNSSSLPNRVRATRRWIRKSSVPKA